MSEWGWLVPVLVVAMLSIWGMFSTWVKARHGYPIETERGQLLHKGASEDARSIALLSSENEKLQGQIVRLEERVSVLERIATDPSERTARAIEQLR
jgi:hypothetical protein